ncbi:MAG: adenylate/guanylate cyclase domain-containing protein [Leptospiraceae bacterium]|nr:adenylate/guanylate cyclase domain-containing protein [Leptospiraceae bacterium]
MKTKLLILFIGFFLWTCGRVASQVHPKADKGVIDFKHWDFAKNGHMELDGQWEFYWNCHLKSNPETCPISDSKKYISVPGIWNGEIVDGKEITGKGFASYRLQFSLEELNQPYALKVLDAATSYNLWLNGVKILSNGNAGLDAETTKPRFLPAIYNLTNLKENNEIIVEISNYHHYKGGLWESISFGESTELNAYRENRIWMDVFLCGSICIMIIYHFGLYILRRKDISSVYFALFCLTVMFRLSVTGERILFYKFPNFNWELGNKIEYATLYLVVPTFYSFLYSVFENEFSKRIKQILNVAVLLLVGLLVAMDISIYSHTALPWEILIILNCIYGLISITRSIYARRDGAFPSLIGFVFLIYTVINDILYANTVINSTYMLPYGLFLFIFAQSFLISLRFSKAFLSVEHLSEDLIKTNEAYSRFVPKEFLSVLNKKSILDVKLGDQIQKEMTILFSDIRGFTSLSESMTPQENFNFINAYLHFMEPVISKNNGFIDKYIGDAIMALFPGSPDDALNASVEMLIELRNYNIGRVNTGYPPIKIGIGLNTGNLMLGTIGGKNRMDGTVISDSVNIASRLESLTKELFIPLIVSDSVVQKLQNKEKFSLREIDDVVMRGKSQSILIYECFDSDEPSLKEAKLKNQKQYNLALAEFRNKKYARAKELFIECERNCPEDSILFIYINRCKEQLA